MICFPTAFSKYVSETLAKWCISQFKALGFIKQILDICRRIMVIYFFRWLIEKGNNGWTGRTSKPEIVGKIDKSRRHHLTILRRIFNEFLFRLHVTSFKAHPHRQLVILVDSHTIFLYLYGYLHCLHFVFYSKKTETNYCSF